MTDPRRLAPRRRKPAYAAALEAARRQGQHPPQVDLIFGDQWKAGGRGVPRLAVRPDEYAPGALDFGAVAGLEVGVVDQTGSDAVLPLLAELARVAAPVALIEPDGGVLDVARLAFAHRVLAPDRKRYAWPAWWDDDLSESYARRARQWQDHVRAALEAA